MYYQSYEEYMRDVLGYPRESSIPTYNYNMQQTRRMENSEIERLYPEIYKTVYPMVCKACNQYNGEITEEFVDRLTNEVYANLETEQEVRSEVSKTSVKSSSSALKNEVRKEEETRQRRPNNNTLRDLIRILIIRELLGLPHRPGRPPFPGGGPRPPFPGGPRPPMRTKATVYKRFRSNELYGRNGKLYAI